MSGWYIILHISKKLSFPFQTLKGAWFTSPQKMREVMSAYWTEDFQIHIHTNGDLAMEAVLDAVEELNATHPRNHKGGMHYTLIINGLSTALSDN